MNKLILKFLFVFIIISETTAAYAMVYTQLGNGSAIKINDLDFLKIYNAKKEKLKKIPQKNTSVTANCAQISQIESQERLADSDSLKADRILVSKTKRKLYLLNQGKIFREFNVVFGFGYEDGPKSQSGDGRTPEGIYQIEMKREKSSYTKALKVSYPNLDDISFASNYGVDPGDSIMIHGFPKKEIDYLVPSQVKQIHPKVDWTQGCMAVTSEEIEVIYSKVDEGIDVEICPLEKTILSPVVINQ